MMKNMIIINKIIFNNKIMIRIIEIMIIIIIIKNHTIKKITKHKTKVIIAKIKKIRTGPEQTVTISLFYKKLNISQNPIKLFINQKKIKKIMLILNNNLKKRPAKEVVLNHQINNNQQKIIKNKIIRMKERRSHQRIIIQQLQQNLLSKSNFYMISNKYKMFLTISGLISKSMLPQKVLKALSLLF